MQPELPLASKLAQIKSWLGVGSINIFGLPMSGKDTVGVRLAEALGGKMLSSGMIIRAMESATSQHLTDAGELVPSDVFSQWVLPYFSRPELKDSPLILSSIGRWSGEENSVILEAEKSGHPIKAVLLLNISEADVLRRRAASVSLGDRGSRADDKELSVFNTRLKEFRDKTAPVILHYDNLGLLVSINADASRDEVFVNAVNALFAFSQKQSQK
ncbi:nucleoside monophosphate kinase [Candidatus Saccharibacteria bacterium]|nr:nucleoside monophosphate kinase [Candidatus Saccharibacteria bacterium]